MLVIEVKLGVRGEHEEYIVLLLLPSSPGNRRWEKEGGALSHEILHLFSSHVKNTVTLKAFKALSGAICYSTDCVQPVACIHFLERNEVEVGGLEVGETYVHAFTVSSKPGRRKKRHFLPCEMLKLFPSHVKTHIIAQKTPQGAFC